jgi:hypothetical protein
MDRRWRGHEATGARQWAHRSEASGRSGARKLTSGGQGQGGEGGELFSRLTQAREMATRAGDSGKVAAGRELIGGGACAQREEGGERCGGGWWGSSPYIWRSLPERRGRCSQVKEVERRGCSRSGSHHGTGSGRRPGMVRWCTERVAAAAQGRRREARPTGPARPTGLAGRWAGGAGGEVGWAGTGARAEF